MAIFSTLGFNGSGEKKGGIVYLLFFEIICLFLFIIFWIVIDIKLYPSDFLTY